RHGRREDRPGGRVGRLLAERQLARGGGADRDGGAAGDRAAGRVLDGDGLAAGRLQRDGEGAGPVGQRRVRRQDRLAVGAGEVDGAGVAGDRVAAGVQGGDGDAEGGPG